MTPATRRRGTPPADAGRREARINAGAARVVAVLIVLYVLAVAGFFVYDQLL